MLTMLRHWSKTMRIGLDIARSGVRAVQCRRNGDVYSIAGSATLDHDVVEDESTVTPDSLASRIRDCIQLSAFRGRSTALALSAPELECLPIELPPAVLQGAGEETLQVLRFEVDRLTTFSDHDLEVDYWTLPSSGHATTNTMAVAATSTTIRARIRACERASLTCTCIDAAATALARLGATLGRFGDADVWAMLDLGYAADRLIVCVDAAPILVRNVGRGGEHGTRKIAEALRISMKSAEIQKRDHGLPVPRGPRNGGDSHPVTGDVAELIFKAVRSELNETAAEIKRSYEYVLSCYPSRHARDLILVGGGAAMNNLSDALADLLGIPVLRASSYLDQPTCRLRVEPVLHRQFERIALAAGLSMEPNQ
jgi:type IV pilus assembly protein PilM